MPLPDFKNIRQGQQFLVTITNNNANANNLFVYGKDEIANMFRIKGIFPNSQLMTSINWNVSPIRF